MSDTPMSEPIKAWAVVNADGRIAAHGGNLAIWPTEQETNDVLIRWRTYSVLAFEYTCEPVTITRGHK